MLQRNNFSNGTQNYLDNWQLAGVHLRTINMARTDKQATAKERQQRADRRELLLSLYSRGLSHNEIGRELGVSHTRVGQLIERYNFLPQSRYMLEGALCRDWMLRHRPKEYRAIVAEAAEQTDSGTKGE